MVVDEEVTEYLLQQLAGFVHGFEHVVYNLVLRAYPKNARRGLPNPRPNRRMWQSDPSHAQGRLER